MDSEWTKIGSIAQVFDGPHATPKKIEDGPYFLSISSLENGKLDLAKSARISEEQFKKWTRRVTPEEGDVLFSYETRLGEAALMPNGIKACLGRRMGLLRPDRNKVDPKYLLFAYIGPEFQQEIKKRTNYGATVERIALKELPDFPINLPPLPEQKAIAHILGSLDDKIELNRRMNATLEAMAQALFKSWFVDFDPVIDNALAAGNPIPEELADRAQLRRTALANGTANRDIAKLFPSTFKETEFIGWIPEGWETSNVGNHVSLQRGTTYKSKLKGFPGPYLLGLGAIERNGGFKEGKLATYGGDCPEKITLGPDEIFVSLKDLTQAADLLGSVARIPPHITSGRLTQDTVALVFNKSPISRDYIYNVLLTPRYRDYCRSHATGTTNLGLAREDFFAFSFPQPSREVQGMYDDFVSNNQNKHQKNTAESITITKLRDTLLPKLISGELRIPESGLEKV